MIGGTLLRQIWWRTVSLLCGDRRYRRGLKLLKANLTPSQLNEFLTYRCFDVVGGVSGRIYRIRFSGARNVEELDREGRCIRRLASFLKASSWRVTSCSLKRLPLRPSKLKLWPLPTSSRQAAARVVQVATARTTIAPPIVRRILETAYAGV